MCTVSQLKRQLEALQRKYALELSVARLHRIAEEFSLEWTRAVGDRRDLPESHPFILRIARQGFRFNTFLNLYNYLENCRGNDDIPTCYGIVGALHPHLSAQRLSQLMDGKHPVIDPRPAPALSKPQQLALAFLAVPSELLQVHPSEWTVGWALTYPAVFQHLCKSNPPVEADAKTAPAPGSSHKQHIAKRAEMTGNAGGNNFFGPSPSGKGAARENFLFSRRGRRTKLTRPLRSPRVLRRTYPFRYLSKNSMVRGQARAAPSALCRAPVQSMKA